MTDHRMRNGTSARKASTRIASRTPRLALAGLLVSIAACNRVEPEQTSSGQKQAAQPAVGDRAKNDSSAAPKPIVTNLDHLPAQPLESGPEAGQVLPPVGLPPAGQAMTSTNASQGNPPRVNLAQEATASGQPINGTNRPGVHIEMTSPSLPTRGADTTSQAVTEAISQPVPDREFMKLTIPESNRPEDLLQFFGRCDKGIQELTMAAHTQQMSETEFQEHAKRLSQLKLDASERMLALSGLTPEQQKLGTAARVESLSHLTSLGDVPAAQKLQTLAAELSQSSDPQLAHQGKLVLLGFRLNQLVEGQLKDPQTLLEDMAQLFKSPEDRGLVELMALQRCADVLSQLGYSEESKEAIDLIVREYSDSPDPELSMRAWLLQTNNAPTMVAFNEAVQGTLNGTEKDASRVAQASAELLNAFPSVNTLWHVTRLLIPLEFSGNVPAASEVAKLVNDTRSRLPAGKLSPEIDRFLDSHWRRLATLGKPLELTELATFGGRPFDWASYRGKVVLICFWASWEINSLEELQKLTQLRQDIPSKEFEIVTINLDDANMNSAEQMVRESGFPWPTLRSSNPNAIGFATSVAKELGVNAVPFVMLVDRQGRVAAIHARGEKAISMITELLSKS